MQLFSLILILILLLFFLVSIDLLYTGSLARLEERKSNCFLSKIFSSLAKTTNYHKFY